MQTNNSNYYFYRYETGTYTVFKNDCQRVYRNSPAANAVTTYVKLRATGSGSLVLPITMTLSARPRHMTPTIHTVRKAIVRSWRNPNA